MSELISRQLLDLWNRYKPTIAVDAIEFDRELRKLLSTNLASLGTDRISRQAAIDELVKMLSDCFYADEEVLDEVETTLKELPSAQPEIICCKDCKHYEYGICKKAWLCVNKSPNGFCDWGER